MKAAFSGPLEKVDDCCWRIPKGYRSDMRVDGLIFANDKLMETIRADQAPDQVANVATLPGIQGASLAMPDIHWGYGFCIGGVCATDPADGGVISPGGVGYDINCLTADAEVLHRYGYVRRIGEMTAEWKSAEITCFDLNTSSRTSTGVHRFLARPPKSSVHELTLASGDRLRATADHPVWTPHGMLKVGELRAGDLVGASGFTGVPYERPSDDVIVCEDDVRGWLTQAGRTDDGRGVTQAVEFLKGKGLLPLRYSSPATPVLCKVAGFLFGDGTVRFEKSGKGVSDFYGTAGDLELIRADLTGIGLTPSRVYSRERTHTITTAYKSYAFDRREDHFKVVSTGFAALLACLGVPVGKKASQDYTPPVWLDCSPLWHRRLFLAALFGAELTKPKTMTGHDKVFPAPALSQSKRPGNVVAGRRFLHKLSVWLAEFGVETQALPERAEQENADGSRSVRLRLILSSKAESLLNLWGKVGYEYHRGRSELAAAAVQYIKHQERARAKRAAIAAEIATTAGAERSPTKLTEKYAAHGINRRFIERALYDPSGAPQQLPESFPSFTEFCDNSHGGMVWEEVIAVEPVVGFNGLVYDFTVDHPDHNFVANGIVVSNCGVRLCKTNLFLDDVKPHLRELVKELFHTVPAGVGRTGKYKFTEQETRELMGRGASYAVGRELGVPRDLGHIEANGRIEDGDPDEVSKHAVKRGSEQCGTLGSGNHFMEVQVVDQIADADVAKAFGLELNQVCVMIHSGSRGLGYQVCDDALASFRNAPAKYGITLPDRQLACAPVDSPEGKKYIAAMRAAANFGFCNRQLLMQQAREVFAVVFGRHWEDLGMELLYDVAHNIAKLEEHTVDGKKKKLWVHRKGATRAFPAGHPELPPAFKQTGQPVIIPGDMGRASWVLVGGAASMERTFGSTCHGAGRAMSRTAAKADAAGRRIDKELESRGVIAMASSRQGLAEEQPKAYKNVDDVVSVVHNAGLSRKVARMRPIGVIKG